MCRVLNSISGITILLSVVRSDQPVPIRIALVEPAEQGFYSFPARTPDCSGPNWPKSCQPLRPGTLVSGLPSLNWKRRSTNVAKIKTRGSKFDSFTQDCFGQEIQGPQCSV